MKKTMNVLNKLPLVALILAPTAVASEVASHCAKSERTYFSCEVKGGKVLSLCGTPTTSGAITGRRYAFGARDRVELAYPGRSAGQFLYSDYARYMTEYREIGFTASGYKYIVFARYIGDSAPGPTYGVEVIAPNGKGGQIPCTGTVVDRVAEFGQGLECDPANALGCRK
jgi:hypothetical protein